MGNGASQSLRHGSRSDSRISSIRLDTEPGGLGQELRETASRGQGNNTVTLHFTDYAPIDKPRARSLSGADATAVASAFPSLHELHAMAEGHESHSSSAASMAAPTCNNDASPRLDDAEGNGYDNEAFEEDTIEWKRGEALGSGSYGTVYLARDERTGALMAVKEIVVADESDDDVRHASREVELLRSLHHPNIVTYLGSRIDHDARKLCIFTEWVPGGNLEQNRKRFGGNSECVVRRFTRQMLQGVAYLHAKRIIHHDIKPSNILVDQFGVVKLADFGSSRLLATSTLVNNESMRGTPNYMAPEVIKQTGPRSFKSDIWSVGCSVLRLLTGLPLWGDKRFDSQIALLYFIAHLEELPPLPTSLSPDAHSFIQSCLEIDPAKRPSAEELLNHPFVGGPDGRFVDASPSFLLPSRSTMVSVPPVALRVSTAPVEAPKTDLLEPTRRAPPGSAPGASISPKTSKSQLVGIKFPSRGLVHDQETGIKPSGGAPLLSRSSRTLGAAAASIVASPVTDDLDATSDVYTFSEFAETIATTPRPARWDDQPIVTDAARAERERQLARVAEEKRKKDERERQFQQELVEFRRQHHAR